MTVSLRIATPADAETIAPLHLEIWRDIYRDLAPPAVFDAMTLAVRLERWHGILADPTRTTVLAEVDGALAGFGLCGPPSHPIFGERGEIKNLFVGNSFARRGLGRRLTGEMARTLLDRGHAGIGLAVVVGNTQAIAFYESLGGRKAGAYTDPGPLWRSDNLFYVWDDATALAQLR
jgi:ribosomal protein S18 acetylase RimI-like enzyme